MNKQKNLNLKFFVLFFLFTTLLAGEKHCLWQVQGQKNSLFLLGSVHMLTKAQYPLPAVFDSVYAHSDALIFEVDVDSARSPQAAAMLLQKGLLDSDQTLRDVLKEETFKKVQAALRALGQPPELYLKMKPWFLSLMLNQLKLNSLHFDPRLGLEVYFSARAKQDRKPMSSLETLAEQVALLEKLSNLNVDQLVLETLDEIERTEGMMAELITAWQTGNSFLLDSLMNVGLQAFPEVGDFLLVKRNLAWLSKIEPLLQDQKNYLIVVGAGHLVGSRGLVQLLHQKGYRVTQM